MIIAQLASCEPDTNYVTVTVHPVPYVDAGQDEYIMEGTNVHLRAIGVNIDTFMWSNGSSLSCVDCANPVATPTVNSTYVVNVATSYGCRSSDSVSVKLYCASAQVFLPNSFTPNGDGENDVFYPRGVGIIKVKNFRIYNRWGQLLFERVNFQLNDPSQAWDGTYNGDAPRPDVYVYLIDATCDTGETVFLKGDVTIIH
jgi:gliding motility-associated-like protein